MERRTAKLIIGKVGGTASKDAKNYKIALPSKWVTELMNDEQKMELVFDGEKIVIFPHLSSEEFLHKKKSLGHRLMKFEFYDKDTLCTEIYADFTDETISAENRTENIIKTAFGNNKHPSWQDFQSFLEERCVAKNRSGLREYLEAIGAESYEPLEIIKKTAGRMAEDDQWIRWVEIQ